MRRLREKYAKKFAQVFGVPLSQYWDDNHGGFQAMPFMTQVLEYEGPYPYRVTSEKFGVAGLRLLAAIFADITDYWTVPF